MDKNVNPVVDNKIQPFRSGIVGAALTEYQGFEVNCCLFHSESGWNTLFPLLIHLLSWKRCHQI